MLWYTNQERMTFQGTATCLAMTDAHLCKRILEVACGPGLHSETIAMGYLQPGARLVSCDFSKEMVKNMKKRFEASDFAKLGSVQIDDETDYVQDAGMTFDLPEAGENEKLVVGC